MKLLFDRLKKLERQAGSVNQDITAFNVVAHEEIEQHKADMLNSGYRLVRDQDGFLVWDGPD